MTQLIVPTYDVLGIGFGPSNLALAIALQEQGEREGRAYNALFLDRQQDYRWHGNTLVSQSELQISFLKDLVTLRNPSSPYSFVNYLHAQGRLVDFINLGTFYPCRLEYNDYLRWVAQQFADQCAYGESVVRVEPVQPVAEAYPAGEAVGTDAGAGFTAGTRLREPDARDFDAVCICSGLHEVPYAPHIDGIESYTGLAMHSAQYKECTRMLSIL